MKKIVINVQGMHVNNITGIPRYIYEILKKLDSLIVDFDLEVEAIYGTGTPVILPELHNIKVIEFDSKKGFSRWVAPRYARKENAILVCMGTSIMLSRKSVGCIHDIRPLLMNGDSLSFRIKHFFIFISNVLFCQRLVTVSNYQKQLIHRYLLYPLDRIKVIHSAWNHFESIGTDVAIFKKIGINMEDDYFYSLGSIAPHKNYKWIYEVAKRNPQTLFIVAGGKDLSVWGDGEQDILSNIIYPGYVTDAESKALMTYAKAFIMPSKFEGFGLPPLEALSCGTKIFVSSATCLPEVYRKCAVYFDPDDYNVDLENMLKIEVDNAEILLNEYTWEDTARKWLDLLIEVAK